MAFGLEIKRLREEAPVSAQNLADRIGVKAERLRKWEEKDLTPRIEDAQKIEAFFGMDLERVMKLKSIKKFLIVPQETSETEGLELKEDQKPYITSRQEIKNGAKKKTIPFYDAQASAGITETEMTAIHAPSGTIDVGDLLHDSEAAIRIYGNSMIPNYPPGCVVGLIKCDSLSIEPGEVYVIETRTKRVLKRLFYPNDEAESDRLSCVSDNTMKFEGGSRDGKLAYPAYNLPKKEITSLFMVTGVIKRNTNSVIINR